MVTQLYFKNTGDSSVIAVREVNIQPPKPDEVLVRHTAIGVNFFDIKVRSGQVSPPNPDNLLGMEACGVVETVGSSVNSLEVGDRVVYATCPTPGAYAEKRCIDQKYLIKIPETLRDEIVAAGFLKGLTVHMLARRAFIVRPNNIVLVHAAGGGVGGLLCQWCKSMGSVVIGTVGDDNKITAALENGCDLVFNHQKEGWHEEVLTATRGIGVNVVYDSIGRSTYTGSIACLMPMGILVSYGSTSGVAEVKTADIAAKSLFFTRPTLFDYQSNRMELTLASNDVLEMLKAKLLRPKIHGYYPLVSAAEAHLALESRRVMGSLILKT
jgi:NADPH2:quinone reductase